LSDSGLDSGGFLVIRDCVIGGLLSGEKTTEGSGSGLRKFEYSFGEFRKRR
jgi:hypothetical protein